MAAARASCCVAGLDDEGGATQEAESGSRRSAAAGEGCGDGESLTRRPAAYTVGRRRRNLSDAVGDGCELPDSACWGREDDAGIAMGRDAARAAARWAGDAGGGFSSSALRPAAAGCGAALVPPGAAVGVVGADSAAGARPCARAVSSGGRGEGARPCVFAPTRCARALIACRPSSASMSSSRPAGTGRSEFRRSAVGTARNPTTRVAGCGTSGQSSAPVGTLVRSPRPAVASRIAHKSTRP